MEKSEAELRICIEKPRQNVEERDEMIGFMSRKADDEEDAKEAEICGHGSKSRATFGRNVEEGGDLGDYCTYFSRIGRIRVSQGLDPVPEASFIERIMERNAAEADGMAVLYGQRNDYGRDFLPSASVAWMERSSEWQQESFDSSKPVTSADVQQIFENLAKKRQRTEYWRQMNTNRPKETKNVAPIQ
ncbi:uncharacterized protein LOC131227169 isoform X2 [Magnolia sinica]|uniref:uncharacterized protein LOC131227169 isoform X2 n=1 Tax=Magnolia sinica TaxID=86752 RepID=UPI002658D065|nr:uncharacterized protein LOC131227169 isoform X2 [Magnolia sinica]XP_058078890.1 uncharacterized protein LOC131227169 isoform X2 [Magnolia sinica]XP_058078891.1 uncharacterized protein LOC131227169 isoform X2 [Magnolia sinica]XP_058078892.1 uncharacterized protein LOC131227169 isoform X2 [Magnolia sinica]XP_058078893.1 uncharacterized protein LOC131227169 isoform X2 [Magnolia sinica]XP_058078894.1 uncharacterized protein LOC131227169 isoform X2 [Magnolia sinica]XP_058078895.1 uncharacterize